MKSFAPLLPQLPTSGSSRVFFDTPILLNRLFYFFHQLLFSATGPYWIGNRPKVAKVTVRVKSNTMPPNPIQETIITLTADQKLNESNFAYLVTLFLPDRYDIPTSATRNFDGKNIDYLIPGVAFADPGMQAVDVSLLQQGADPNATETDSGIPFSYISQMAKL